MEVSTQRQKKYAKIFKENQDLSEHEIAKMLGLRASSVRRYVRMLQNNNLLPDDFELGQSPLSFDGSVKESPSFLIQQARERYAPDCEETEPEVPASDKVKFVFGDLHMTDEDVMWKSIQSALRNTISYLQGKNYKYVEIINIGDTVSGTAIFRGQEARNLTNKVHWQTMGGALFQSDMVNSVLDQTSIEDYEIHIVKGNHDQAGKQKGTNLAHYLVQDMKAIGMHAIYDGNDYLSDNIYAVHGFGNSDYYPESPKFMRTFQKKVHNLNQWGNTNVDRVVHGHTHWANVNFQYSLSCKFDCVGGFQRNERADLGKLQRPAGFIVYEYKQDIWDQAPSWKPTLIPPHEKIFWKEAQQVNLEFVNVERIGGLLRRSFDLQAALKDELQPVTT